MTNKALAVGAVALIVIVAAGAVVIYNNANSNDYEYDYSKGWYSWDPIAFETKTAYYSITPLLLDGTEKMYKEIYGKTVDYGKYSVSDVPDDFLSYESLVVSSDADTVVIKSTIRESSDASGKKGIETTVKKNPTNMLTTSGYAATLYTLLEMKYGADEANRMLWDYVYGLDKSSWTSASMSDLYGLPIPDGVKSVNSTYYLITNLEEYIDYIQDGTSDGESLVMMMAGALGNSASELGPFFNAVNAAKGNASALFFFSNGVDDVLAAIEVIGAVYGLEDEAQEYIDGFRLKMYAIHEESAKAGKNYTVYFESNSGTAAGSGTITSEVLDILCLDNINKTSQWQTIPEERIIDEMPKVIIFYDTNTKSWDERMRVGVL